ncbi:MAG TPA: flagellar motor protein MotB [Pirellulales bacterium]|nr:flagellar motor protein MotB [Pirellulales bacterium]
MSKKCRCEEGLAEWIMSYADMITILMAFFVVMYSMAGDKDPQAKTEAVMGSLRQWLGPGREHWPLTWGIPKKRLATELDVPAPADRHRAATENTKSTVPQPNATFPDGVTIYLPASGFAPAPTENLDRETRNELARVVETVAGKMNLIEIRGQARRHFHRQLKASQNAADLVYQKCRVVMEHLIEQGINPERIQIRIVRAEGSGDESKLAAKNHDIQIDVFMLGEVLEPQPGVEAVNTGILD